MLTANEVNVTTADQLTAPVAPVVEAVPQETTEAQEGVKESVKEEAPTGEASEEPKEGAEEKPKHDPYKGFRKQIDKLSARNHAKEAVIQAKEAKINELAKVVEELKQSLQAKDYSQVPEAQRVKEQVKDELRLESLQQQAIQTQQDLEQEHNEAWNERVNSVVEKYPDYQDVVGSIDVEGHPLLIQAIKDSEYGPDIAYFLGKNKAVAQSLAKANPITAAMRLMEIEQMVKQTAEATTETKKPKLGATPAPTQAGSSAKKQQPVWERPVSDFIEKFRRKR